MLPRPKVVSLWGSQTGRRLDSFLCWKIKSGSWSHLNLDRRLKIIVFFLFIILINTLLPINVLDFNLILIGLVLLNLRCHITLISSISDLHRGQILVDLHRFQIALFCVYPVVLCARIYRVGVWESFQLNIIINFKLPALTTVNLKMVPVLILLKNWIRSGWKLVLIML